MMGIGASFALVLELTMHGFLPSGLNVSVSPRRASHFCQSPGWPARKK